MSLPCLPQGITTAKVTLILGIKKPLHKPLRGIVLSPLVAFPVLFCFFRLCFDSRSCCFSPLPAGARLDGHIGVNLEHWVPGVILEKHSQGTHFFWNTTGFWNARDDSHSSDYALNGGVVGGPHHLKRTEVKTRLAVVQTDVVVQSRWMFLLLPWVWGTHTCQRSSRHQRPWVL